MTEQTPSYYDVFLAHSQINPEDDSARSMAIDYAKSLNAYVVPIVQGKPQDDDSANLAKSVFGKVKVDESLRIGDSNVLTYRTESVDPIMLDSYSLRCFPKHMHQQIRNMESPTIARVVLDTIPVSWFKRDVVKDGESVSEIVGVPKQIVQTLTSSQNRINESVDYRFTNYPLNHFGEEIINRIPHPGQSFTRAPFNTVDNCYAYMNHVIHDWFDRYEQRNVYYATRMLSLLDSNEALTTEIVEEYSRAVMALRLPLIEGIDKNGSVTYRENGQTYFIPERENGLTYFIPEGSNVVIHVDIDESELRQSWVRIHNRILHLIKKRLSKMKCWLNLATGAEDEPFMFENTNGKTIGELSEMTPQEAKSEMLSKKYEDQERERDDIDFLMNKVHERAKITTSPVVSDNISDYRMDNNGILHAL